MLKPQLLPSRRVLLWLISILILLGVMDSLSAIFLKFVLVSSAHFLVWNPNIDAHEVWTAAGGNWDDELGWPSPSDAVAPPRDRATEPAPSTIRIFQNPSIPAPRPMATAGVSSIH